MPVKQRTAKGRRPAFPPEMLELFARLEDTPPRKRRSQWFKDADYGLHRRLGVGFERLCSQVSVLDRRRCHHRPESPQAEDFRTVRALRLDLLAALGRIGPGDRAERAALANEVG